MYQASDSKTAGCKHTWTVSRREMSTKRVNGCKSEIFYLACELPLRKRTCLARAEFKAKDKQVNNVILKTYVKGQTLWSTLKDENGQDLVEYGLVIVLVCLAATAGMGTLANGINAFLVKVSGKLSNYAN